MRSPDPHGQSYGEASYYLRKIWRHPMHCKDILLSDLVFNGWTIVEFHLGILKVRLIPFILIHEHLGDTHLLKV